MLNVFGSGIISTLGDDLAWLQQNAFLVQIVNTVSGKITEVLMYASNVVENSYVSAGVGNGNYAGQSFNFGGVSGHPSAFYGFNWSSIPIMLPNEELRIYFGYSSNYPSAFNITIVIDYYAEAISSTISG